MPGRDVSILAVILPQILDRHRAAGEHSARIRKVQAPVEQGPGALGRVEADIGR